MPRRTSTTEAQPSRRRPRREEPVAPLGSLTQLRTADGCSSCGSARVTRLAMHLTDGTPVTFTSCHHCESRRWIHDGEELTVSDVLARTRKPA